MCESNLADKMELAFHNPVETIFGTGIYLHELRRIIGNSSAKVKLFYGRNAMKNIGAIGDIKKALGGCQIEEQGNIAPYPDIQDVKNAISNANDVDLIIAIGGGSVLDFAKSVAFLSRQGHRIEKFLEKAVPAPNPGTPFIAIPTTSGTGSEVTPWATIWDNRKKRKYMLAHEYMFPEYAIVDPELTLSLPARVTAYTAFDALSHAFEAFWSRYSNPVSDSFAIEAIGLIMSNLAELVNNLNSLKLRSHLAAASLYAGLAYSNTKTTAVHAVSYPMTLHYGVPHGIACALTLGAFLTYNRDHIERERLGDLLDSLACMNVDQLRHKLDQLARSAHLPISLKEAGIPREGIQIIIDGGFHPERVKNNPRQLTKTHLRKILESIYE